MRLQIADCRLQIYCRLIVARGLQIGCGLLIAAWAGGPVRIAAEVIDRVLAVVAGDVITLSDVRAAREFGFVDPGAAADPDREVLSRLIDRALILDEVERYAPPEPDARAVDAEMTRVRARFTSSERFAAALAESGIDDAHLRATVREELRIRAYVDQRFQEGDPDRRRALVDDWVATLRRRAAVVDLYSR